MGRGAASMRPPGANHPRLPLQPTTWPRQGTGTNWMGHPSSWRPPPPPDPEVRLLASSPPLTGQRLIPGERLLASSVQVLQPAPLLQAAKDQLWGEDAPRGRLPVAWCKRPTYTDAQERPNQTSQPLFQPPRSAPFLFLASSLTLHSPLGGPFLCARHTRNPGQDFGARTRASVPGL